MKQQVAQQAKQISQLQREKDALGQRLRDMQGHAANNKQLKDNLAKLQQQLKCERLSTVNSLIYVLVSLSNFQLGIERTSGFILFLSTRSLLAYTGSSRHSFSQSDAKLKPIGTWSLQLFSFE